MVIKFGAINYRNKRRHLHPYTRVNVFGAFASTWLGFVQKYRYHGVGDETMANTFYVVLPGEALVLTVALESGL